MKNPEFNDTIHKAVQDARDRCHENVTLVHLLRVLLKDDNVKQFLDKLDINIENIIDDITTFLDSSPALDEQSKEHSPKVTEPFISVLRHVMVQNMFIGKFEIEPMDLLIGILYEQKSEAFQFCKKNGLTFDALIKITDLPDVNNSHPSLFSRQTESEPFEKFCFNFNEMMKDQPEISIFGHEDEILELITTLMRFKRNNAFLVGDIGVGKTTIVKKLTQMINKGEVPEPLKNNTIWILDSDALETDIKYPGEYENRIYTITKKIEQDKNSILFVENFHDILKKHKMEFMGGGVTSSLKPALTNSLFRYIGTTTPENFERYEMDEDIKSLFQKIEINEPSADNAKQILRTESHIYKEFYKRDIDDNVLDEAVDLSVEHIHDAKLPNKAFDLIETTFARNYDEKEITKEHIASECRKITGIKNRSDMTYQENVFDNNIEDKLKKRIFGQDTAIEEVSDALYIAIAGLKEKNKPVGSYLFTGPTGVGKTETAKGIADIFDIPLVRFDMSEFMEKHAAHKLIGSPPGYIGYGDGKAGDGVLINELKKNPKCVLLFDEIEKAHEDVVNILLQVMDDGIITGLGHQKASACNAMIIMTSNLGAVESEKNNIGFCHVDNSDKHDESVKNWFKPEFRNRLDAVVRFNKLDKTHIYKVANKFLEDLKNLTNDQEITLSWNDSVLEFLANNGFEPTMGARPMNRLIREKIKKPLAKKILFERIKGNVSLDVQDDGIIFV